ncbi:Cupin domain protein [Pirellulimonas nuda]|uniref:Cupin domain protein n=1 Tax=Pirellulimonas nuda TaxID=2528009 RepID=A0A518D854_9BACT|nr:cupin domain-containing protein [Pirellulimonas nuda]QDU87666.1 Cupin domain protein [Pirellulimonas nuda]
MPRYAITQLNDAPPVPCPCGQTRRAFVEDPDGVASMHVVEVTANSRTHYHKRLTELYYVLEGEGTIELDGQSFPIVAGTSVLIKPGCRHRAVPSAGPLRVLNVPVPAFDETDEWFD